MAHSEYIDKLRKEMLSGVTDARHQRLVLNAVQFAEGIIEKLGPYDYGLAKEGRVDKRRVARAIGRFTGRNAHWVTVVSVPPGLKDVSYWWADTETYRRTLATAVQLDHAFPYTRAAKAFDLHGKADAIDRRIAALGHSANFSVSGAAAGLTWGGNGASPGYPIWYNTILPVLKTLCLAAAFNQPTEADRVVELATVMREVLPLGEKKSQEFSWVVLAAP